MTTDQGFVSTQRSVSRSHSASSHANSKRTTGKTRSLTFGALFDAPWALVLVVGAVYGGLIGADSAIYSTAVTELAPAGRIGSAQAIQAVAGFGIGSLGPVVAGAALDLGTGWLGPFVVAGAVGIACALPLLGARSRERLATA